MPFDTTESRIILVGSMLYVTTLAIIALIKKQFTNPKLLATLFLSTLNGLVLSHAANCMLWGDCQYMVKVFIVFVFISMIGSSICVYNSLLSKSEGYGYNYRSNQWVPTEWPGVQF